MKSFIIKIFIAISAFLLASSCTKNSIDSSAGQKEIYLSPFSVKTRASLYDSSNIISNENKGNFSVIAYRTNTNTRYFLEPERIYYMYYPETPEASEWRFYHKDADDEYFYKRYWPQTYALDFFAYMPYDLAGSHVSLNFDEISFSCELPTDGEAQDATNEFVYAFSGNQTAQTNNGTVNLRFIHPFSAVRFKLGKAHGNTEVKSVGFSGIYNKGIFSNLRENTSQGDLTYSDWTPSGSTTALSVAIGKRVPDELQLDSPMGGTYLVLPQSLDAVKITVSFNWEGDRNAEVSLGSGKVWEPGKIYTYTLNLGDNQEDILMDVSVEEWDKIEYDNVVEVE